VKKITDFIKRIGVEVELPQDLSISLGSFGINLENLVKSYAIFPNGGKKIDLKSIISIKIVMEIFIHLSKRKKKTWKSLI
jgi:penicillin-binding protein 1A